MKSIKGSFRRITLSTEELNVAVKEFIENHHNPTVVFPIRYTVVYNKGGVIAELQYLDK